MSFVKIKSWLASLGVLALVACGGGGGSGGDPIVGGGQNTVGVADVQIKFDTQSVDNTGQTNVVATITAVNANGQGVAGVPLVLKVDNNATFSITSESGAVTGSGGTVTAEVTIGNDYSLRTITMSASAGGLPLRTASFQVVGNRQAASDLTLIAGTAIPNSTTNSLTVTATAVDANRNALPNIPVTFKVDSGATLVPSGTVTGANGTITGILKIGQDQTNRTIKVTATSGTVVRTTEVFVTGAKLTSSGFSSTVGTSSVGNKITYLLVDNTGAKMAGYPITVTFLGLDVTGETNVDGEFLYTYAAPDTAQALSISARAGGAISLDTINVTGAVVIPPATLVVASPSVSASPNVVGVNALGGLTTNKVEIRALFLAANNAPVKNVRVWFDLDGDKQSIGGTLESTVGARRLLYSDANGIARTTYAPGSRFSPKDGVTVRVCWAPNDFALPQTDGGACPNAVKTTLTVVSESLSVSIGTNGTIAPGHSDLTYIKRFVVQVVDSAGQAKAGVQVSSSIDLLSYFKGEWKIVGEAWSQGGLGNSYPSVYPMINDIAGGPVPPERLKVDTQQSNWRVAMQTVCDNEDLNRNGVGESFLDEFEKRLIPEDQNGSAALQPQRPLLDPRKADVTIAVDGSSSTDENGIVVLKIEYPQNLGSWVRFNILVSASGVAGTEGRANFDGVLEVSAAAVTNVKQEPAFRRSPYGTQSSPTYLRKNLEGQSGWLCTNPN